MKTGIIAFFAVVLLATAGAAFAGEQAPCEHPNFVTHECLDITLGGLNDGADGDDGANGRDGSNGADGRNGTDGQDGAAGRDGIDGQDGADGRDGVDGKNGADGRDGVDGLNGIDGQNGRDGVDGVVPTEWIDEVRSNSSRFSSYLAASDAIQIYLPQDQTSRITFGASQVDGTTGFGLGYAYRCHECERAPAITLGVGTAKDEVTGKVSIGWEF